MRNAYTIILMIMCYFLANVIYSPTLEIVEQALGTTSRLAKATMTAFQMGAFISCLTAGIYADYVGKARFLNYGLLLAVLGTLLCSMASTIELLLLGRFLQGAGAAIGFMMGFALAVDLYPVKETLRIIALNGVSVSAVSVFAPTLGGFIVEEYGWRFVFVPIVLGFTFALYNCSVRLPERAYVRGPRPLLGESLQQFAHILTAPRYFAYALLNGIYLLPIFCTLTVLPFYLNERLNSSAITVGLISGGTVWGAFALSSYCSVSLYQRFGIDPCIRVSLALLGLGAGLTFLAASYAPLSLTALGCAFTIFYLGFGGLYSGSISQSLRVFPDMTTKASSLRTILLTVGSLGGTLTAQSIDHQDLTGLAVVLIATAIAGVLAFASRHLAPEQPD